ncbi:MAG: hypothetical protein Q9159_004804, partial [Coniocarpon cinnabarinum]
AHDDAASGMVGGREKEEVENDGRSMNNSSRECHVDNGRKWQSRRASGGYTRNVQTLHLRQLCLLSHIPVDWVGELVKNRLGGTWLALGRHKRYKVG